jgi:hypothetical protein
MPKKEIPFSKEFKDLILDMDFGYFLNEDFIDNNVSDADRVVTKQAFEKTTQDIKLRCKKNKKQCRFWLEGIVRLQWHGGMLPAQLKLDGFTRELTYFNHKELGENWAWFAYWQKLERKRRFWKTSWDRITKLGALLAIILTVLKLLEVFNTNQ